MDYLRILILLYQGHFCAFSCSPSNAMMHWLQHIRMYFICPMHGAVLIICSLSQAVKKLKKQVSMH